jgi:hypothetical protein
LVDALHESDTSRPEIVAVGCWPAPTLPAEKLLVSLTDVPENMAHATVIPISPPKIMPSATTTFVVHRRGERARAMSR